MSHRRPAVSAATVLFAAPVLAVGIALAPAVSAVAASGSFTADATGGNEISMSGQRGAGLSGATASGTFTADDSTGQFCYTTTASGLPDAVAMHIHKGGADTNGPVVIPLDAKNLNHGRACTSADPSVLAGIIADPSGYYLNVHTPAYSAGAVRGQLQAGGPSGVAAGNGGQAAQGAGLSGTGLALVLVGAGAVGAAGWRLTRRTR